MADRPDRRVDENEKKPRPGVRLHLVADLEIVIHDGFPVTTPMRTLWTSRPRSRGRPSSGTSRLQSGSTYLTSLNWKRNAMDAEAAASSNS